MKNPKTTSVLVGLGLVLVLAYGYARGNPPPTVPTNIFINNTGHAVGGLHIEYHVIGSGFYGVIFSENPNTFTSVEQDGSGGVSLSSGTVAAGGSIQIAVLHEFVDRSYSLSLRRWWWTDGSGIIVGQIHNGCKNPDCTIP